MKFIPSLFILGTLAISTTIITGCGGGSSGGISIPTQNKGAYTFSNINSPAFTNLSPLSGQGPFVSGNGSYADYFGGNVVTAVYESSGTDLRIVDIRRKASTPTAPAVGTGYDLTAGGENTLTYSFRIDGFGYSYEAISGKVIIASKKGNFVTLRLQDAIAKMRFVGDDYRININGTFTYDESKVPIILPTGAKPPIS